MNKLVLYGSHSFSKLVFCLTCYLCSVVLSDSDLMYRTQEIQRSGRYRSQRGTAKQLQAFGDINTPFLLHKITFNLVN